MKYCNRCGLDKPDTDYTKRGAGLDPNCRDCQRVMRQARAGAKATAMAARVAAVRAATQAAVEATFVGSTSDYDEVSPAPEPEPVKALTADDFILTPELVSTWAAVQVGAENGDPAANLLFIGPSGSGKTDAARRLARLAGTPFTQVDAPSMTDPESWFGTREVVIEDGSPKTVYVESDFITSIQCPGVTLIDEGSRVPDAVRNILLSLLDGSRRATNPLTGKIVKRDPKCFIVITANVGLAFTGTYAIDPAFLTRVLTTKFDYLGKDDEIAVAVARTGCSRATAELFVRFASETRERARQGDFPPLSTREVIEGCKLVARGLSPTLAANQVVINAASDEGGAESVKSNLERIWAGIKTGNDRAYLTPDA